MKINAFCLGEAFCHETRFLPFNFSIGFVFYLVNPLRVDRALSFGKLFEDPCSIFFEYLNLFLHGLDPFWILHRLAKTFWLMIGSYGRQKGFMIVSKLIIGNEMCKRMYR
ncbi:hypothetical protein HanIR_Chr10g0467391 [Helianthus annuus]|nr:hypothetical protein HanIR_Chr10g0467391 [Helianthus annuus]